MLLGIFLIDVLGLILKRREKQNSLVGSDQSSEQKRELMIKRNEVRTGVHSIKQQKMKWRENDFSFYQTAENVSGKSFFLGKYFSWKMIF